jgi:CRP-like cAMP-binding protein
VTGDTQFDNFGAVAVTECVLVWLKRVDYLRICSSLVPEVTQILKLAVEKRTEEQLDVISSFFHQTPLFNWLFYPDLQWECSKRLSYLGVQTGSIVVSQGERAKQVIMPLGSGELQAYTGVRESDDSDMRGNHIRELHAGDAIGLKCFQHDTATQGCGATVCAVVNSDCAVLRRTDWDAINKVKHKVYKALKKPFALRSRAEITRIWSMFKNAPLVRRLDSRLVQSHLCRLLAIETYEKDEFVYTQGDIGDHMYFVLDGALVVEKWRAKDQSRGMNAGRGEKTLGVGDEFGEAALMAKSEFDRRHKETVVATEKCRLAVLSRYHRTRLIESSDGIQDSIDMLWDLAMNTRYGADRLRGNEMLNQETYMKLYMNMVRLLHPEWTDEEAADLGRSDWLDDVRKSGTGRKELYHEHFSAVIYDLIDNWCDQIATSMYSAFIGAVYKNCRCFWRKVNAKDCRDLYVAPEAGQQVEQYVLAEPELTKSLTKQLQPVFADGREKYKRDIAADKQEIRRQHASRRHLKQKYKSMKRKESNLVQRSQRPKNGLAKRQGKSEVVADMHWNMLKTTYGAEFALQEEQSYFCQLLASRCEQPSWTTEQETQFRMLLVACVDVGNVRGGSQSGYDNLLDILQQAYFGDSLAAATARSNREVQRLEAKFGTVLEDSARALLVVRIMRKNEGSPYWLTSRTRAIDSATRSDDAQLKLLLKQHQLRAPTPDRDTSRLKSTRLTREQILAQEKLLEHQSRARVSAGVAHKLKRQRNSRLASQTLGTHRFAEPHYYASALANRRPKQRSQAAPAGTIVQTLDAAKQEVSLLGLAPPESATQPGRIAGYRLSPPDMDSSFISSVSPFWGPASPPPDAHAIVLTRPYSVHEAARSPPCPRRRHKKRGSKSPQLPLIDVKIRAE